MQNRRAFLGNGVRSTLAAGTFINLNPRAMGANERVNLALIGGRNQGRGVALHSIKQGARIKTFCDLDDAILEKIGSQIAEAQGVKPGFEKDFRHILADKEIEAAISLTTCGVMWSLTRQPKPFRVSRRRTSD